MILYLVSANLFIISILFILEVKRVRLLKKKIIIRLESLDEGINLLEQHLLNKQDYESAEQAFDLWVQINEALLKSEKL